MPYLSKSAGEPREQLRRLAGEIAAEIAALAPDQAEELLGVFVSELFASSAERSRRETRRRKQAEGIAGAKARGVRFGRTARPLPANFEEVRQAWRRGECTLQQAADACGMPRGTFYDAASRAERADEAAV